MLLAQAPWPAGFIGQCARLCPRHWGTAVKQIGLDSVSQDLLCSNLLTDQETDPDLLHPSFPLSWLPANPSACVWSPMNDCSQLRAGECPLSQVSSSLGLILRVNMYTHLLSLEDASSVLHSLGLSPLPQLTPPPPAGRVPVCLHLHFLINLPLSRSSSPTPLKPLLPESLLHAGFSLSTETVPSVISS